MASFHKLSAQAVMAAGCSTAIQLQILVEALAPSDRRRRRIPLDVVAHILELLVDRGELPAAREIEERIRAAADARTEIQAIFEEIKLAADVVLDDEGSGRHARYIRANRDRITGFLAVLCVLNCDKVRSLQGLRPTTWNPTDEYAGLIKAGTMARIAVKRIGIEVDAAVALVSARIEGAEEPVREVARNIAKEFVDKVRAASTAHFVKNRKGPPTTSEFDAFVATMSRIWSEQAEAFRLKCPLPTLDDGSRREPAPPPAPVGCRPKLTSWDRIVMVLRSVGGWLAPPLALVGCIAFSVGHWGPDIPTVMPEIASLLPSQSVLATLREVIAGVTLATASWSLWSTFSWRSARRRLEEAFARAASDAEQQFHEALLAAYREAADATIARARELAEDALGAHREHLERIRGIAAELADGLASGPAATAA